MRFLRRLPFTITLIVLLIAVAGVTGPFTGPSTIVKRAVGIDVDTISHHEWWSLLTAEFFVDNFAQLVIVLVAAAIGVGVAERMMGSRRTILVFLVTGVVAAAVGLAALSVGILAGEYWADGVRRLVTIDPLSPILGTVAAASAFASVLWRRRIRFIVIASVVVFLLYSGQPSDLYRLIAVLVGVLLGSIMTRRRIRLERWTSSHHETRVLLAVVAAIFALGPIITLIAHGRFGLLSPLGSFITDGMPHSRPGAVACSIGGQSAACNEQLSAHAGHGFSAVVLALLPLAIVLIGAYGLLLGRRAAVYVVAAVSAADGLLAAFYFGVIPWLGTPSHEAARAGQSPEFAVWIVGNALLPLVFAGIVLSQQRHFPIRVEARARRRFLLTMGIATVIAVAGYLLLGMLFARQFRPVAGFLDLLGDLPERFIPVSFLDAERRDFVPVTLASRLLYHGVGPLLWLILLVGLVVLVRGRRWSATGPDDAAEFRRLERERGGSMSFPGTWVGNSYWFDADRRLAIAYRVANGCAVTTGDPVGDPQDPRDSLGQFIRFCDSNA